MNITHFTEYGAKYTIPQNKYRIYILQKVSYMTGFSLSLYNNNYCLSTVPRRVRKKYVFFNTANYLGLAIILRVQPALGERRLVRYRFVAIVA